MMVAFVFSMAHTLDTASKQLQEEGVPVKRIGYQDDQYFKTKVKHMPRVTEVVTNALTQAGHKLNESKCAVWVPALDHLPDHELPEKVADLNVLDEQVLDPVRKAHAIAADRFGDHTLHGNVPYRTRRRRVHEYQRVL